MPFLGYSIQEHPEASARIQVRNALTLMEQSDPFARCWGANQLWSYDLSLHEHYVL
jgi:hypothetical protein